VTTTNDQQPTPEDWRDAYEVAQRIKAMEPWLFVDETDIFAVQHPESGELGFASVMGKLGEHFAVGVYLGPEGLRAFWEAQDADLVADPYRLLEIPQLMLSFEDREMLRDRDRRLIKQLGLRFRGRKAWPLFRSFRPGFMPWYLEAYEVRYLTDVLRQVLEIVPRFREDPGLLETENEQLYFARIPERRGDRTVWKDGVTEVPPRPASLPAYIPDDLIEQCRVLRSLEDVEMDLFCLPTPIGKGHRPYYPYVLLLVGADNGFVLGSRMLAVESSIEAFWAEVPVCLAELMVETATVPKTAYVRLERLGSSIAPLAEKVGFKIEMTEDLPELDLARHSLVEFMTSAGNRR
jgi:hypothetical protein